MSVISITPIHMLNSDILLDIFAINGNIFSNESHAVYDTRGASQVCRQWRTLMINTPSIWARLLDAEELYYISRSEWWKELIRRSEDALLWIRVRSTKVGDYNHGRVSKCQLLQRFFITVIHENWHRIQKLFIDDIYSDFGLRGSMLCFPAPRLEEFNAKLNNDAVPGARNRHEETEITPIFAGHAPMLERFSLSGHIVDQKTPWLRHLPSIELDLTYNIRDTLTLLSATHQLRYLKIHDIQLGNSLTPLPNVSLPHLQHFTCYISPPPGVILLNHMTLPLGCALTFEIAYYNLSNASDAIKARFFTVFKTFARRVVRYVQPHLFDILHLCYFSNRSFSLKCRNTFSEKCLLSISLPLSLSLYGDHDPMSVEFIFNELASLDLTSIICLKLQASESSFDPFIRSFLDKLQHMQIIHIGSETLAGLLLIEKLGISPTSSDIFFPFLQVVVGVFSGNPTAHEFALFEEYILWRAENGCSITTLDFTRNSPFEAVPSMDALAEVQGLKVLYKRADIQGIFEYTCGSADPERHLETK